jgi:hypothetical protein
MYAPMARRQTASSPIHQRQRHPDNAPVFLDTDLVRLHLPKVARLLDEVLLHSLALDASPGQPTGHRPLVETERDNDGLPWTPMGYQRDHQGHGLGRGPEAVQRRALCRAERFVAQPADEPLVLARVEANVALAGLASGRAPQIGAEYACGVHGGPPGVVGEHAKRSLSGLTFSLPANLTTV